VARQSVGQVEQGKPDLLDDGGGGGRPSLGRQVVRRANQISGRDLQMLTFSKLHNGDPADVGVMSRPA